MRVLGIDTSCDDSSVALVEDGRLLRNLIASQDVIHREWGGVVPNLARQAHAENLPKLVDRVLRGTGTTPNQLDLIAVTKGPGLAIALEVGLTQAHQLAEQYGIPLLAINHMEGHLLSPLVANQAGTAPLALTDWQFPSLAILISGKHTQFVRCRGVGDYTILGETRDDAFGEAFDKVARLLGLGYPGGGTLAQLAEQGNPRAYPLPIAMRLTPDFDVSYSGLKAAMSRLVQEVTAQSTRVLTRQETLDLAASFQRAAVATLMNKVERVLDDTTLWETEQRNAGPQQVLLGGGAAQNVELRRALRTACRRRSARLYTPFSAKLCKDNAGMIAFSGWLRHSRTGETTDLNNLDRLPNWPIDSITKKT